MMLQLIEFRVAGDEADDDIHSRCGRVDVKLENSAELNMFQLS